MPKPTPELTTHDGSTVIARYQPKWTTFEISSLLAILAVPVIINLTIAESPNAWALSGFSVVGVLVLGYLGRTRKRESTVTLTEDSNGSWTLHQGAGNITGHEQSLSPTAVTSFTIPHDNDSRPGYLLMVHNDEGDQEAKMRIPARLVETNPDLCQRLISVAENVPASSQRDRALKALKET